MRLEYMDWLECPVVDPVKRLLKESVMRGDRRMLRDGFDAGSLKPAGHLGHFKTSIGDENRYDYTQRFFLPRHSGW